MESAQSILDTILRYTQMLPSEEIPLMKSVGRIAGRDIVASADFPSVTLSLIDGFATRFGWIKNASKNFPVYLKISKNKKSKTKAASPFVIPVKLFEELPHGFDVVLGGEDVSIRGNTLSFNKPIRQWENLLLAGSKVQKGDALLRKGDEIGFSDVGMASFLGLKRVPVIRKPRVALIFVCPPFKKVKNKIAFNKYINGISDTLEAQVLKYRGIVKQYKIATDFSDANNAILSEALKNDIAIFIGECSRKSRESLSQILNDKDVYFHLKTSNIIPGSFFAFGMRGNKLIFLLPNDLIGTILNFEEFIRPALFKMRGKQQILPDEINARLGKSIQNSEGKISLIQTSVHLKNGIFYANSIEENPFSSFRKLRSINGIIVLPQDVRQVPSGSITRVQMLRQSEWDF